MRRFLLPTALVSLLLIGPALADDAEVRRLDDLRQDYEVMLRDSRTETAAKYFVDRLAEIAVQRRAALTRRPVPIPKPPRVVGLRPVPATGISATMDRWLKAQITAKVSHGVGLSDVTAWTRRELPEAFWTELERGVGPRSIPPRVYARQRWASRTKLAWQSASYGSGTFIVQPVRRGRARKDRWRDLPDEVKGKIGFTPPKPPTRDQWWARASTKERADWVLAYTLENSGLFELSSGPVYTKCQVCNGTGYETRRLQGSIGFSFLCRRCAGAGKDKTIRYR
ncbi:MAG: hypothetical protein QNJ90_06320 [Planctomycetota bacterium]|nr:hypothetical protein [Planctomycetota bacterium]